MKTLITILLIVGLSFQVAFAAIPLSINGVSISRTDYTTLKVNLISKITLRQRMSFNEIRQYISIANRDIRACKIRLTGVNNGNLLSKLNVELLLCNL